jgi:uncharacterized protein (UPF0212 family)
MSHHQERLPLHGIVKIIKQAFINQAIEINKALEIAEASGWLPIEHTAMEDHDANLSVSLTLGVLGLLDHVDLEVSYCPKCHGAIVLDSGEADWMHVRETPDGDEIDRLRLTDCPHCMEQIDEEWVMIDGRWTARI